MLRAVGHLSGWFTSVVVTQFIFEGGFLQTLPANSGGEIVREYINPDGNKIRHIVASYLLDPTNLKDKCRLLTIFQKAIYHKITSCPALTVIRYWLMSLVAFYQICLAIIMV